MTTETKEITNSEDMIDVRDVIARFEELETERENACDGDSDSEDSDKLAEFDDSEAGDEYTRLKSLLDDVEGNGGDEEWRGSWYPVTLIRESYFKTYAEELAEDIGAVNSEAAWPNNHIDWEAAADELLIDYTSTEFDGVTYYYR